MGDGRWSHQRKMMTSHVSGLCRRPAATRVIAAGCRKCGAQARGGVPATHSGRTRRAALSTLAKGLLSVGAVAACSFRTGAMAAEPAVDKILDNPNWPDAWPFNDQDFERFDETSDTGFYSAPRFVTHIDDGAIKALTQFYASQLPPSGRKDVAILDMCSSWISHYPPGYKAGRIIGLGMNAEELKRNPVLTSFDVVDLNKSPKLPYDDNTFDVITNAVSVDYLNKPREVFQEMHRVLKQGGMAIMSFSNRCFPTKAIAIWTGTGDPDHVWIVGSYFHYSVPGGYTPPKAKDISLPGGLFGHGDPMYVVYANKA